MTCFLYLPANPGSGSARRVDFAKIGDLFADEEPAIRETVTRLRPAVTLALLILLVVGDAMLLGRSDSLAACLFKPLWIAGGLV